jgi:hypothetical protein
MKRLSVALALLCLSALPALAIDKQPPDLAKLPDLTVSPDLGQQWVVRDEQLDAALCSVEEGHVDPGVRKIVRFTVTTPNIGGGDVFIGDPREHVAANDGLFEFAECHHHYHFKHYATYELVDPVSGFIWKAAKRGFCMLDTDPNPAWMGQAAGPAYFKNCGDLDNAGNQGISHGWSDTYRFFLGGQYFVLDGGDGQPPVPPGNYTLRITVNPPYAPDKKGNCPRVKDPATGLCHQFAETDYTNNVGTATITVPAHPGRQGVGPLNNTTALGYEPSEH